jgi:hypothetical protein
MNDVVIVALIGALGSALGSIFGIIASSKLTQYRLSQLEEKVDKHNSIVERTYVLEGTVKELTHEVTDLKKHHAP